MPRLPGHIREVIQRRAIQFTENATFFHSCNKDTIGKFQSALAYRGYSPQ
ncbi:hypothetical protein [Photorhabdus khanii]|nr:hypothetical protein [Photorhabdus khanii]